MKTFLLVAQADYTEGSMLLVIDSLEEFISLFKEYHHRKMMVCVDGCPGFFDKEIRKNAVVGPSWSKICDRYDSLRKDFVKTNNLKPFDFEFSTGCSYIENGKGAGNFYKDVKFLISPERKTIKGGYWLVHKQFNSDLPRGTHYLGDYCS